MKEPLINSILFVAEKTDLGILYIQQEPEPNKTEGCWKIVSINKPFFNLFGQPYSNIEEQSFNSTWIDSVPEISTMVSAFNYSDTPEIQKKSISIFGRAQDFNICYNKNSILFWAESPKDEINGFDKSNEYNNELFQTLLEYSLDTIYFKDKNARFIKNSKSHRKFFKVEEKDLIGKTDFDFFREEDAKKKYNDDLNVIRTGKAIINKEEIDRTPSGKVRWVSSTKIPLIDKQGNINGLFGISRDITEKREAELKINRLNENFQELITTGLGFQQTAKIKNLFRITSNLLLDKFKNVQLLFLYNHMPQEKYEVYSYPSATSPSVAYRTLLEYILYGGFLENQVFENGRASIDLDTFFKKNTIKGFEDFSYKAVCIYQLNEKNESFGYALIFRNLEFQEHDIHFLQILFNQLSLTIARIHLIEKLELSIQKAEESDRLKTAFLNNISHEVRTPLNSVIGYSQLIIGKIKEEDTHLKGYAKNVISNAKILLEFIEDIIEISKLQSGQISIILQETNINELIDSLEPYLKEQLTRRGKSSVTTEYIKPLKHEDAVFRIDSVRIFQIFKTLISNAVKFIEKGNIRIGYLKDLSEITFFVEDTGIGIPENVSNIIFNLFRQGDESATRKHGGIGVGLSIANALVKNLGGKINFKTKPNEGSTFFFSVPINR